MSEIIIKSIKSLHDMIETINSVEKEDNIGEMEEAIKRYILGSDLIYI